MPRNLSPWLVLLFSLLLTACTQCCGPDERIGSLGPLPESVLQLPYTLPDTLVFRDSSGERHFFVSPRSWEESEELGWVCYKCISGPKLRNSFYTVDLAYTYRFWESDSHLLVIKCLPMLAHANLEEDCTARPPQLDSVMVADILHAYVLPLGPRLKRPEIRTIGLHPFAGGPQARFLLNERSHPPEALAFVTDRFHIVQDTTVAGTFYETLWTDGQSYQPLYYSPEQGVIGFEEGGEWYWRE